MSVPLYQEAVGHFLAGISLSMGDRYFSKNASRHSEVRRNIKLEQVTALHYLTENSGDQDLNSSPDYHKSIMKAREYFMSQGERFESGKRASLAERIYNFKNNERINPLSIGRKLGVAFALELSMDAIVESSQLMWGRGNGLEAFGESFIQTPAFLAGLMTGKGVLYIKDLFRSKEERELNQMAEELTTDGKVLAIVQNYSPTQYVKALESAEIMEDSTDESKRTYRLGELKDRAVKAIDVAGERVGSEVIRGYNELKEATLGKLQARIEAKKAAEKQRKTRLKGSYDKY